MITVGKRELEARADALGWTLVGTTIQRSGRTFRLYDEHGEQLFLSYECPEGAVLIGDLFGYQVAALLDCG